MPNNEKFHNMYSSPNIICIINQGRMRRAVQAGHFEALDKPMDRFILIWNICEHMGGYY
jgi:hypothetical protein